MRTEYKRDINGNYLLFYEENEPDTSSYQVRMLVGNTIPSVLKCRVQGVDGQFMICFDITSKQSVASMFEDKKIGYDDLKMILSGFVQIMEEMSEYLLNPGKLLLNPEYMYADIQKRKLYFCYVPGFEEDVRQKFQELTEYILPKLDHEDANAVMLGYSIYRLALEDSFHLEYIKKELYQEREEKAEEHVDFTWDEEAVVGDSQGERVNREVNRDTKANRRERVNEEVKGSRRKIVSGEAKENRRERVNKETKAIIEGNTDENSKVSWEEWGDEKKKEGKGNTEKREILLWCAAGALFCLTVLVLCAFGYFPWFSTEIVIAGIIVVMEAGMLGVWLGARLKKRSEKREESGNENLQKYSRSREQVVWEDEIWEENSRKNESENVDENAKENENVKKNAKENRKENRKENTSGAESSWNETVVLSANIVNGPATLVSREPGEFATIYLQKDLTVIGKMENAADAVLDIPTVSRVHAKIRKRDGFYYLTDLNSRNGTSVNGKMLRGDEDYCLQDQDEVDFAQARYVFLNPKI